MFAGRNTTRASARLLATTCFFILYWRSGYLFLILRMPVVTKEIVLLRWFLKFISSINCGHVYIHNDMKSPIKFMKHSKLKLGDTWGFRAVWDADYRRLSAYKRLVQEGTNLRKKKKKKCEKIFFSSMHFSQRCSIAWMPCLMCQSSIVSK